MDNYFATNRELWDGWAELHAHSDFYDVPAFLEGESTLNAIELDALGDVQGLTLLHLQCHFGLDTLSWARLGAQVTGVDFSERAITLARSLTEQQQVEARFLCANVYELPRELDKSFDIVFTSYGVLAWVPDLTAWARVIGDCLKPGGTFFMVEFHPLAGVLDDDGRTLRHPYFHMGEPLPFQTQGSYADLDSNFSHPSYEWTHSLGDVVNALISAGLTIESLQEYPFSPYNCFPYLEERTPDHWYVQGDGPLLPLVFSVRASARTEKGAAR